MPTSNLATLTRQGAVWAVKKKRKQEQIKEIIFDDQKRTEYLTGFRKRKLERKESKKKHAVERDRLDRLEARRERRRELAERAKENAEAVEKAYRDDDVEIATYKAKPKAKEEFEFEDEERLATVTVVDDFSMDDIVAMSRPQPLPEGELKLAPPTDPIKPKAKVKEKIKYRAPKFIPKRGKTRSNASSRRGGKRR